MRILWVKVGGLWPVHSGGRRRSFETLAELARRHEVTLVTTHLAHEHADAQGLLRAVPGLRMASVPLQIARRGTRAHLAALAAAWATDLPLELWRWQIPALQREVTRRLARGRGAFDVCITDFLYASANVPAGSPVPEVLFEHNVEHQIWRRAAKLEHRPVRRALREHEWRMLRRYEARMVARARRTIAVSEVDRAALSALAPRAEVTAIATGVDSRYFHPDGAPEQPGAIAFVGAMDWHPNEDAMLHFCAEVLPRVRAQVPAARLTIVGRNPGPRVRALAHAGAIEVTGTVEDVRPHLGAAAVVVVPLRVGGGTRLKIFEALAMGKPVVSTTIGAEGLPLIDGEHFVRADTPAEQARALIGLLGDPARRARLAAAGRRLVETEYGWARVARSFERQLEEVCRAG